MIGKGNNKMKKAKIIPLILICMLLLSSCSRYVSSYSATMMSRSSRPDCCSLQFGTLDGTVVLNTKMTEKKGESYIHYTASLEEGALTVYYDIYGSKLQLFKINGGGSIDERGGYVESGRNIHIIIETDGKARGGNIQIDFK